MDNCTVDHFPPQTIPFNYTTMCQFAKIYCDQDTVQFIQAYYCLFDASFMILAFIGIPLFVLLFKTLNVVADQYLSPSIQEFIVEFKISPVLAGVSFLTFAIGAPDVMTAIIAGSSSSPTTQLIPFGSIFGACLFGTAFIFSTVILSQPNSILEVNKKQIIVPAAFYIFGIVVIILVTVVYGKMNLYISVGLLIVYFIYIAYVVKSQRKLKKKPSLLLNVSQKTQSDNATMSQYGSKQDLVGELNHYKHDEQQKVIQKQSVINKLNTGVQMVQNVIFQRLIPPFNMKRWNHINVVTSLIASPFIIAEMQDFMTVIKLYVGPFPVFLLICIPSFVLLCYAAYCIVRKKQPYIKIFTVYSFLVAVAALTIFCSILINLMELFQILTGMNTVFLGLTVFAWAGSVGDYLTIVHFARTGNPQTAVAGVFPGQLFNYYIGFSISLIIQSFAHGGQYQYKIFDFVGSKYDKISDVIVVTVIVSGLLYLILVLILVLLRKIIGKKEALFARFYYFGFLFIATVLGLASDFLPRDFKPLPI